MHDGGHDRLDVAGLHGRWTGRGIRMAGQRQPPRCAGRTARWRASPASAAHGAEGSAGSSSPSPTEPRRLDVASLYGTRDRRHVWLDLSSIRSARGTLTLPQPHPRHALFTDARLGLCHYDAHGGRCTRAARDARDARARRRPQSVADRRGAARRVGKGSGHERMSPGHTRAQAGALGGLGLSERRRRSCGTTKICVSIL